MTSGPRPSASVDLRAGAVRRQRRPDSRPSLALLVLLGVFPALLLALPTGSYLGVLEGLAYDARLRLRNHLIPTPIGPNVITVGVSSRDVALFERDLTTRQAFHDLMRFAIASEAGSITFDYFFERHEPDHDPFFAQYFGLIPTVLAFRFEAEKSVVQPSGEPPLDLAEALAAVERATDPEDLRSLHDELLVPRIDELDRAFRGAATGALGEPDGAAARATAGRSLAWARWIRTRCLERHMLLAWTRPLTPTDAGRAPDSPAFAVATPPLQLAASGFGFANIDKGRDAVVREVPMLFEHDGRLFPNLSLAAVLSATGVAFHEVRIDWGRAIEFEPRRYLDRPVSIPIDERGFYLVNFVEGEAYLNRQPTLALAAHPQFELERQRRSLSREFKGALILVGETITGGRATDVEPIPLQPQFPMVGLHANVIDNILKADFLQRPPRGTGPLAAALIGLASAMLFRFARPWFAFRLGLLLALFFVVAATALFLLQGLVLPLAGPALAATVSLVTMVGYVAAVADRDRRLVREVFARSVSPRIGEEILRNYADEALWGSTREVTVLFIDIRGYTTLSESVDPAEMLQLLDSFYTVVSREVFRQDGQVNKFLGDAVMALYGALPEESPDHAARALRSAVAIQRELAALALASGPGSVSSRLRTGAGLNTGPVTVGIVGGRDTRIEYTAIGDSVNVASRLQGVASENEVAMGAETLQAIGADAPRLFSQLGIQVQPAGQLSVKGRVQPVEVHRATLVQAPAS